MMEMVATVIETKAGHGQPLTGPALPAAKSEPIALRRAMDAQAAFQAIAGSCLSHYRLNETAFLQRPEPETLHQARVALRRLRSAFKLYRAIGRTAEARRLSNEVRALAAVLGEARDLDALLARIAPGRAHERLAQARRDAYARAVTVLEQPATRALMLDLAEWLADGAWLRDPGTRAERQTPARGHAAAALARLRRRVRKHGRHLAAIDDAARHQVRKDAKTLRYGAEFFAALFSRRKRHRRFLKALETLQDALGALNDLAVAPVVLARAGVDRVLETRDLATAQSKPDLLAAAARARKALLKAEVFWD
jgi:CHAD domain-containing protein